MFLHLTDWFWIFLRFLQIFQTVWYSDQINPLKTKHSNTRIKMKIVIIKQYRANEISFSKPRYCQIVFITVTQIDRKELREMWNVNEWNEATTHWRGEKEKYDDS